MKKNLLFLLLAILPMVASADPVLINGIYYNLIPKGKAAEVTRNPNGKYYGDVVIPSSVTYNDVEYSVTSIGSSAFSDNWITSVTIPNSVTSIGSGAFAECNDLNAVFISDLEAWCYISFQGSSSNPLCNNCHLYLNGEEIKDLVIPNNVTSIGNYAFNGCTSLTSITIPNSVTSIGNYAFQGCTGLTSITIPNSVTNIGRWAFDGCSSLTSITIPNSVTSIGNFAFNGCTSLTSVTIPNSVTSIGNLAFSGCSKITSIIVESGNKVYDSRGNCNAIIETATNKLISGCNNTIIPNSVTSIGDDAFYGSGLTSITIPNSVTSIGNYAFSGCSSLNSATIGNSVTTIGAQAFINCTNLTTITIGSGVQIIFSSAFSNCPELTDVYCYTVNIPATIDNFGQFSNVFYGSMIEYATLHVPDESLQAYKETEPWSNFGTIVGLSGGTPETPKCATPTISYGGKKLMLVCDTEDVEFVTEIKDADIGKFFDDRISLTATYEISVYATKAGYENSDVATATLVWGSATFTDTTPATAIEMVPAMEAAMPVLIQNNGGMLTVQGAQDGTPVSVYTIAGTEAGSAVSQNSCATISTSMQQGDIAIVRIGNRSVKVVIK